MINIFITPSENVLIEVKVRQINFPQINTDMMMNGLSSAPTFSSRGLSTAEVDVDKLYEPKENKKIVRSLQSFHLQRISKLIIIEFSR